MKNFVLFLLLFAIKYSYAQNNYGKQLWMNGNAYTYFVYDGTNKPVLRKKNMTNFAKPWFDYVPIVPNISNICDSATGEFLMNVSPQYIYDSMGNIIDGGDDIISPFQKNYLLNTNVAPPNNPQGSIILPRGNKVFDVFVPFFTDSAFHKFYTNQADSFNAQMNVLLHHVVDMKANNGHGKVVIKKHNILGEGISLIRNGMQAVRHANGKDWWLCKMGYGRLLSDSIFMYTFLVKADTIIGPQANYLGIFSDYKGNPSNYFYKGGVNGQLSFSKDGSQFVFTGNYNYQLLLGSFNRCNGIINDVRFVATPKNQSMYVFGDTFLTNLTSDEEPNCGVIFSPNNRFVYLNRPYQIFQWDSYASDSASAWYAVKLGLDTIANYQSFYAMMHLGVDDRIIIGTAWSSSMFLGGITEPNKKGAACNFVGKYLRLADPVYPWLRSLATQHNYLLGQDNNVCWPTSVQPVVKGAANTVIVYPNPANKLMQVTVTETTKQGSFVLLDVLGKPILTQRITAATTSINIAHIATGLYIYKVQWVGCGTITGKIQINN
jgi:Secretion system C-terminal sorting domain